MSFAVGDGGGSINQSELITRSGRGLDVDQADPLVLWWVKLAKSDSSVDGLAHQSYRRSRWNHPANKSSSPFSPYFAMHREGLLRSLTLSALLMAGLTVSLNTVAFADSPMPSGPVTTRDSKTCEIPSAERFSRMKDFVGKHNQYLNLSKLNEFKWTDETRVASGANSAKPADNKGFQQPQDVLEVQPPAVNSEVSPTK